MLKYDDFLRVPDPPETCPDEYPWSDNPLGQSQSALHRAHLFVEAVGSKQAESNIQNYYIDIIRSFFRFQTSTIAQREQGEVMAQTSFSLASLSGPP